LIYRDQIGKLVMFFWVLNKICSFFINLWCDFTGSTHTTIVWEDNEDNNVIAEDEEEEFLCIICMENPPDTMVLPCRHVTVCRRCSALLPNTADRYTCCRCRNSIYKVVDLVDDKFNLN
jgi:hypothetical protein